MVGFDTLTEFHDHVTAKHLDLELIKNAVQISSFYLQSRERMQILYKGEFTAETMPECAMRKPLPYWYIEICNDDIRAELDNDSDSDSDSDSENEPPTDMLGPIEDIANGCWEFSSVVACIINLDRYPSNIQQAIRRSVLNHCLHLNKRKP